MTLRGPFLNDVMNAERFEGLSRALAKHGLACRVLPLAPSLRGRAWQENWAGRRRRLVRELQGLPRPAAVFAYNDCLAADVIDACRDGGLRVQEEIAVLGVDNDPDVCDCAPVPLSSVRHDLEGMACEAAALLERLMSGRKPPRGVIRIPPKGVVTRVSTDMRAVSDLHVAIALRCLSDRFRDPQLSVADVVTAAGVSRRQLERSFRRETDATIRGHLTRTRVTHAAQLLAEGDLKGAAIAAASGFGGPAQLHRAFRRKLGTTPRRYRARQRSATASP